MKNIFKILILTFIFTSCRAQQIVNIKTFNQDDNFGKYFKDIDNHFTPFLGTWENTTGTLTFRVVLYKVTKKPVGNPIEYFEDAIEGRYLMIENLGMPNETIIYNSVKYYSASGQTTDSVIIGGAGDGIIMDAFIDDNSVNEATIGILPGNLTLEILTTGTNTTAHWKVSKLKGFTISGYDFNIPTDIILTKQ